MKTQQQQLRDRLDRTERTLITLIQWIASSANSPIRHDEAVALVDMLVPSSKEATR